VQFTTLEFDNLQIIDRGMDQAFVDFVLECLMFFFEFRKVRLHRHAACLLNLFDLWLSNELSLAQTQFKGDIIPTAKVRQMEPKPLNKGDFFARLNAAVENAIIIALCR
jgi:hypothetical protein